MQAAPSANDLERVVTGRDVGSADAYELTGIALFVGDGSDRASVDQEFDRAADGPRDPDAVGAGPGRVKLIRSRPAPCAASPDPAARQ